ncbi:MAG TPA: hypothetical protein VFX31_14765 [Ktedonobacterales bacterium]|nr:hypothetical protein [Ktedonobacterales bacterium]HEX5572656.1 hypothetical protein [Ktedonobacterales bacterium]
MPGTGSTTSIAITISTPCGSVYGKWRPSSVTRAAAILIPDAPGAPAGPFRLFDELAVRVQRAGISVLQLEQCSEAFDERLMCLLSALTALRRQGVQRMALVGWHSGGSLAIAAGSDSEAVTGVAALAPDATAADLVSEVAPRRLLLMHGAADVVTPAAISRLLFMRAAEPRELVVLPGERHDFSVFHDEALDKLTTWIRALLRSPFKPHAGPHAGRRQSMDLPEIAPILSDGSVSPTPSL